MNKITWCLEQNRGIKLIEPNDDISKDYIKESEQDFEMIDKSNDKWKAVTSYYACYNALYAILTKIGIKSEIHDCTIALMETMGFDDDQSDFITSLKKERIDTQYYLKPASFEIDSKKVLQFIQKCKEILAEMNDEKIGEIREQLSK